MFPDIFRNFSLGELGPPDAINCDAPLDSYERISFFLNHCSPLNDTERNNMLEVVQEMYGQLKMEAHLSQKFLIPLLIAYTAMIVFGAGGSGLVIYVVATNKAMRSPRNVFIVNLAISDLTLCLFTQPFSLLRLLYAHQEWTLGNFMCKITAMFQGTNIFVSTISITAIALDRFQVIVYPTRAATQTVGAIKALLSIWVISFIMASPLVIFSKVVTTPALQCTETVEEDFIRRAKIAYSVTSMIVQYIAPLVIVIIAYTRICLRIKCRLVNQRQRFSSSPMSAAHSTNGGCGARDAVANSNLPNHGGNTNNNNQFNRNVQKLATESHRQRKTNMLLASIGVVFALSWLPLNIYNIIMDYKERAFKPKSNTELMGPMAPSDKEPEPQGTALDVRTVILIQTMCLMAVLISACTNPVLYGWLNENFRREFRKIFYCRLPMTSSRRRAAGVQGASQADQTLMRPLREEEHSSQHSRLGLHDDCEQIALHNNSPEEEKTNTPDIPDYIAGAINLDTSKSELVTFLPA